MLETLATNASDDPFHVRALPRRARDARNLLDAEPCDAAFEVSAVHSVPGPQHVARSGVPRKGVNNLLCSPLCRRVFRDIEMYDTAPIVTKDDDDKQDPERGGRQREEVDGHQVLDVIVEKASPGLRRWFSMPDHVLGHGRLGNGYAKLHQLAVHSGVAPEGIGPAHVSDQLANFRSDARSTRPTFRLFRVQCRLNPARCHRTTVSGFTMTRTLSQSVQTLHKSPKAAVQIREPRPFHRTLEDGELLVQSEILEGQ